MINRQLASVVVTSFTATRDAYGERRQTTSGTRNVDMMIKIFNQTLTGDVRYNDVELIGLTKDKSITSGNRITYQSNNYDVLYVIPTERYYQILMKKV